MAKVGGCLRDGAAAKEGTMGKVVVSRRLHDGNDDVAGEAPWHSA